MSSAIVLPNLPNWVEQHITSLYGAKSTDDFDSAFDAFVSTHAAIRVNGKNVSRDAYKKMLLGELGADVSEGISGIVNFDSIVSAPAEGDVDTVGTGSVGVAFKAEVFGRFFIFAERQSSTVTSSLNVVVTEDVPRPHQIGRGGAFDGRRVTVLDEVFTEVPNKIVPPTAGGA